MVLSFVLMKTGIAQSLGRRHKDASGPEQRRPQCEGFLSASGVREDQCDQ